jgi:hypothetical protein
MGSKPQSHRQSHANQTTVGKTLDFSKLLFTVLLFPLFQLAGAKKTINYSTVSRDQTTVVEGKG